MIKADKIKPINVYTPVGIEPDHRRARPDPRWRAARSASSATADGVHVYMTAVRSHFTPDTIRVKKGDTVHLHITNLEQAHDATHGFAIACYNVNLSLEPGEHANVTFEAEQAGRLPALLHRVLLGAPPRDGGLPARGALIDRREAPAPGVRDDARSGLRPLTRSAAAGMNRLVFLLGAPALVALACARGPLLRPACPSSGRPSPRPRARRSAAPSGPASRWPLCLPKPAPATPSASRRASTRVRRRSARA